MVAYGDYSRESGALAMRELLAREPSLDVAVAGFDDIDLSGSSSPSLTTVRQPFERISGEMVRLLLEVIAGHAPAAITLPTELVVRQST